MSDEKQASGNNEAPQEPSSNDPATAAFDALREEVVQLRSAVAGLAAERSATAIPDYSETLGKILQASVFAARQIKALVELPALRLTPEAMSREIAAAAEAARHSDHAALAEARSSLRNVTQDLRALIQSARTAEDQRVWLLVTGICGVVAGIVLWAFLSGPLVRAAPASWHWPERMAANILAMDEKTAGSHLIEAASPELWQDILLGDHIVVANRDTLSKCQREKAKLPKRCIIILPDGAP